PSDVIGVFDEAHNLEDAAREHSSRTLTAETLERAELELAEEGEAADEEREVVAEFREALENAVGDSLEFGEAERIGSNWEDVTILEDDGDDDEPEATDEVTRNFFDDSLHGRDELLERVESGLKLASRIDRQYEREYKSGDADTRRECASLTVFSFMRDYLDKADEAGYLPIAGVRRRDDRLEHRLELYTCIPKEVTSSLFDALHSSILMSATLRPFDVLERVVGLNGSEPVELAYGLEYPAERRETFVADVPPLFSRNRDDPDTVETVTRFLEHVIEHSAGNVLVFFPSFGEAERYYDKVDVDATVLLDQVGESAA
ncbi:MAG: ATP-dependent DNA helicase, partial [Halobacteria archaeon]|nr:ATP-dependent DNA helicase [Halobacteria archaeon]